MIWFDFLCYIHVFIYYIYFNTKLELTLEIKSIQTTLKTSALGNRLKIAGQITIYNFFLWKYWWCQVKTRGVWLRLTNILGCFPLKLLMSSFYFTHNSNIIKNQVFQICQIPVTRLSVVDFTINENFDNGSGHLLTIS